MIFWLIRRWLRNRKARREPGTHDVPQPPPRTAVAAAGSAGGTAIDRDAAISVRGLRKSYDGVEAVRGIDFDVRRGEIVAFLGPNGAGKTTSVEILEGYRSRTSGDVRVLGVDPAQAPREWRSSVGVVLQESQPEPYLTARQCLELYAGYFPRPRAIGETLALVGLMENADTVAARLSGGQRRRLDVALALIGDPELVFLDEPTTGFDPSARRSAWEVVAGLRQLGKTILLTTHYMDEAERLADRIIVLAAGVIAAEGTPSTLGGRNRAAARIAFTLPDGVRPEELPEPFAAADADGRRVMHRTETPMPDLHALSSWALAKRLDLSDVEVRRPTLEDVYLELTGGAA
jgi:ABC-2 type transport system ATP-binding protein